MPTRPVWPFALVAALALVVIWVAAASPVFVVGEPYRTSGPTAPEASPTGFPTGPLPTGGPGTQTPFPVPDWVGWIINGGAVLALVLLALAVVRWLLRRQRPVRLARPGNLRGLVDALNSPSYSTAVGLLHWGMQGVIARPSKRRKGGLRRQARPPASERRRRTDARKRSGRACR